MRIVKPLHATVMLIVIVLLAELAIMYIIDSGQLRSMFSPEVINSIDAAFLTLIAAASAYWLLVLPLRRSIRKNSQLATAIAHTSMGYLSYDPYLSGGTFLFSNEAFKSQTGFDLEDIKGKTFADLLNGDALKAVTQAVKAEDKLSIELLFPCKDNSTFWAELKLIPIFEENGLLNQYVILIYDATDKRRSNLDERKMLRAIEQSSESIIITDIKGVIEYVNPAFEKTTGYTAKEAIGNTPAMLSSNKHDREWYESLWSTIMTGKTWSGNHINRRKDGTEYDEFMTISPIRDDDGRITHFVSVQRDVSKQTALEKQLRNAQKLEAVGTLAGGIAHDFNNALAGILGHAYLLKDEVDSAQAHDRIRTIEELGLRSAEIVKQLLSFSREQESEKKEVSAIPFINETAKFFEASIPDNIKFSLDLSMANDLTVKIDVVQLQQVIMNMIGNAVYAVNGNSHGTISLSIEKKQYDDIQGHIRSNLNISPNDDVCVLSIQDNGCGIAKENMEKIFDPFFSSKPLDKGTGLGLAMSYGIVNQHHGYIHVDSVEGKGTQFEIYLPAVSKSAQAEEIDLSTISLNGIGRTIMVVDDNMVVRLSITEILEGKGFTVIQASDGYKAIDMYQKHQSDLDLILMDIVMPNLGGIAAAKKIRESDGKIPIIFLTAYDPNDSMADIVWMPKVTMITKPYDPLLLNRKIAQFLSY